MGGKWDEESLINHNGIPIQMAYVGPRGTPRLQSGLRHEAITAGGAGQPGRNTSRAQFETYSTNNFQVYSLTVAGHPPPEPHGPGRPLQPIPYLREHGELERLLQFIIATI